MGRKMVEEWREGGRGLVGARFQHASIQTYIMFGLYGVLIKSHCQFQIIVYKLVLFPWSWC